MLFLNELADALCLSFLDILSKGLGGDGHRSGSGFQQEGLMIFCPAQGWKEVGNDGIDDQADDNLDEDC